MVEHTGWLLDLYAHPGDGIVLWMLDENAPADAPRLRLVQPFPVTFYAAGPAHHLRALWRFLKDRAAPVDLSRRERRDLFKPEALSVLAVQVTEPAEQPGLFLQVSRAFPDLTYYDADLPVALRHAAVYGTFPLAHCQVASDENGRVHSITVLDSPWDLDPVTPPLRILSLEPDVDPAHAAPTHLVIQSRRASYRLSLEPLRPFLINLRAILERHDPDLLLTTWGDTWLLPRLLDLSRQMQLPLPLNREAGQEPIFRRERSYFTYGQVIHRGRQVHLVGRWHIDGHNAMLFHDYGLEGALEMARVTRLPLQTAARVSPGTGISSMQIVTALRQDILVPWHKQQAERPKTALDMLQADQGGLVYQPIIGLHPNVAEIDFVSMYPSIMARFNVSPETVGTERPTAELVPELGVMVDGGQLGLVPQTLKPLLDKRITLKLRLATLPAWDPRRKAYQARVSAHKWLLVTCFGYLGYKNARFGRIEAHEAVTAFGREILLRAKEAAEDMGYTVLHLYVDGMWVRKDGAALPADFQPLLNEIIDRTGLSIALDGVYRWLAFLPSRLDERVPVANRYFGAFQDSSLKVRGIEARRRDTPAYISQVQMEVLERLAQVENARLLAKCLPEVIGVLRRRLAALRSRRVPLEELLVSQKLSRELEEYRTPSPAARAAAQLEQVGKPTRPGQCVRFLYTLGEPGVRAWDLPGPLDPAMVDAGRYAELLFRAAYTVLQPLGVDEATLRNWLFDNAGYLGRPGERIGAGVLPLWAAAQASTA
jgi:DNA polymerase-2